MDENAKSVLDSIKHLDLFVSSKKVPFYNDEPKIFQYVTEVRSSPHDLEPIRGYGSDIVKSSAYLKSVYEAIERACLKTSDDIKTIRGSVAQLPEKFINPSLFQSFTTVQLNSESFERMRFSEDSEFNWTSSINALTEQEAWIPSQLVFCPYDFLREPVIRFPSSNGAALGHSVIEASSKAVLELIERDSFMCWYLAAARATTLDVNSLSGNEELAKICATYQRYKLDLRILLLPTKWPFYVAFAVIIDDTGIGPGLRVGMKCHPHLLTAVNGAIAEAQQMRPWLRDHIELYGLQFPLCNADVRDSWTRAMFWARSGQYNQVAALWNSVKDDLACIEEQDLDKEAVDWQEVWSQIVSILRKDNNDLFLIDVSGNLGSELGLKVIKAIMPHLQPIYMDERFPYLHSKSLQLALDSFGARWNHNTSVESYDDVPPHPFS